MYPGKQQFITGACLLCPIVFFGLGLIGFGSDLLTLLTGSLTVSKLIVGALSALSTGLLVNGYLTMRDGVDIRD